MNDWEECHDDLNEERIRILQEKRQSPRKSTRSAFTLTLDPSVIEGMGSDISQTGAYVVTCDDIPVEVIIRGEQGKEHRVQARIKRIDRISKGSRGVAIEFDRRILDI